MTRYLDWNYDLGVVIQYERQGECNRCGQCCTACVGYQSTTFNSEKDGLLEWTEQPETDQKGIWSEEIQENGEPRMLLKLLRTITPDRKPCGHYSPETGCAIQGKKPRICQEFPTTPREIVDFDQCSYTFAEVGRWPMP